MKIGISKYENRSEKVEFTSFFVSPCSIEFLGQKLPGWRLRFIKMIDVGTLFFPPVHPVFFSCRRRPAGYDGPGIDDEVEQ